MENKENLLKEIINKVIPEETASYEDVMKLYKKIADDEINKLSDDDIKLLEIYGINVDSQGNSIIIDDISDAVEQQINAESNSDEKNPTVQDESTEEEKLYEPRTRKDNESDLEYYSYLAGYYQDLYQKYGGGSFEKGEQDANYNESKLEEHKTEYAYLAGYYRKAALDIVKDDDNKRKKYVEIFEKAEKEEKKAIKKNSNSSFQNQQAPNLNQSSNSLQSQQSSNMEIDKIIKRIEELNKKNTYSNPNFYERFNNLLTEKEIAELKQIDEELNNLKKAYLAAGKTPEEIEKIPVIQQKEKRKLEILNGIIPKFPMQSQNNLLTEKEIAELKQIDEELNNLKKAYLAAGKTPEEIEKIPVIQQKEKKKLEILNGIIPKFPMQSQNNLLTEKEIAELKQIDEELNNLKKAYLAAGKTPEEIEKIPVIQQKEKRKLEILNGIIPKFPMQSQNNLLTEKEIAELKQIDEELNNLKKVYLAAGKTPEEIEKIPVIQQKKKRKLAIFEDAIKKQVESLNLDERRELTNLTNLIKIYDEIKKTLSESIINKLKIKDLTDEEINKELAKVDNSEKLNEVLKNYSGNKEQLKEELKKDILDRINDSKKQQSQQQGVQRVQHKNIKQPINNGKNEKVWLKAVAGAVGLAAGLVLSSVPGVGKIRMGFAAVKITSSVLAKYAESHQGGMIDKAITKIKEFSTDQKEKHPKIAKAIDKIKGTLKNPYVKWGLNGLAIGYMAGNFYEMITKNTIVEGFKNGLSSDASNTTVTASSNIGQTSADDWIKEQGRKAGEVAMKNTSTGRETIDLVSGGNYDLSGLNEIWHDTGLTLKDKIKTVHDLYKDVVVNVVSSPNGGQVAQIVSNSGEILGRAPIDEVAEVAKAVHR